jgi:FkbH-like protein
VTLPRDFYKVQHLVGKKVIRRSETSEINSTNVFNGRIFVVRNEAWEPHLNHAARIASIFGINLEFEYSIYDDSPSAYPLNRNFPVLIWLNWDRVLNKEKYIQDLETIYDSRNPVYLILPSGPTNEINKFKNLISSKIRGLRIIEITIDNESIKKHALGYSQNAMLEIATYIGQNLAVQLFYPQIKALILDLDNTLYMGILGEDNLSGLVVTSPHKLLQAKILELFDSGILINIVSKNNADEVESLLNNEQIMAIPKDIFTYVIASWKNKSESVDLILQKLNIDQESIVFIDDNPRELFEMGLMHSHTLCINASDPNEVIKILGCEMFSKAKISSINSAQRSKDIIANELRRQRLSSEKTSQNVLRLMGTNITSKFAETTLELERSEELFQKTNQFNFSNQRSKIEVSVNKEALGCVITSLSDVYSDSGIISAFKYVIQPNSDIVVQEFVISCRALGRGVEISILNCILKFCLGKEIFKTGSRVFFVFNKSERNVPAQEFIGRGFVTNGSNNLIELDKVYWATIGEEIERLTN